jgi:hypothetical protein
LHPLDQGIIHAAKTHRSGLIRRMLANISVDHNENVNTLEALSMFSTAWKNFRIATVSNCQHKAGTLSVRDKIMEENPIDDDIKDKWQQIHQKVNVPTVVTMEDLSDVDSDFAVIQKATEDIVNGITEE